MLRSRPPRAALLGVLLVTVLAACSGQGADADPTEGPTGSESVVSDGASPVVFAFECDDGGDRERYTTYSAVWEAERSSCTAHRLTGSVPSEQQQAAVRAADGAATLVELAATCADTGTAPWTTAVTTRRGAQVAAALLRYCPGHPETDHLRDALSTYRG
ncbi:hypothetical protein DEI99_007630 [Curtobacterium sp. MCLR17_036]|uniref:hypothetical protein n=1 Tax=Curtobacterium sp. MCLR17_036 TaxID=2175620 RepID=UPI000DA9AD5B|nr:hypothetical protein [Curtobacterium sp. MCLR17_036]WIE66397.1 hypothetical protein DEI99_007630 [Curtobacterium sp. MCLR17_036]